MTCLFFFTIITHRYLRTGYMGYPYGAHTEERLTLEWNTYCFLIYAFSNCFCL